MLVVFTLSVTPKRLLHNMVAGHKDRIGNSITQGPNDYFQKAFFSCHCDDLVAESPFIYTDSQPAVPLVSPCRPDHSATVSSFHSTGLFFFELRGPPAFA